jgi:hypothetical protein
MFGAVVELNPDKAVSPCEQRDCLFLAYRNSVKEWVAAINELDKGRRGHGTRLTDRIEAARFRALTDKAMYNNHIDRHGCEL